MDFDLCPLGICHVLFDLRKRSPFADVVKNLLRSALDAWNDKVASGLLHKYHRVVIKVDTRVAKPTQLLVETSLDKQITYLNYAFFPDRESVILNNNLFHVREIISNELEFINNVFRRTQTILMPMHRLRINAKRAACRATTSCKDLNLRIS